MSVQAESAKLVLDAFATGQVDVLDRLHSPGYVDHTPLPGLSRGVTGLREKAMVISAAFFDVRVSTEVLVDHHDTVVLQAQAHGVHKGDFFGLPGTGRVFDAIGICVFRFVDGLVTETWSSFDAGSLLRTLRGPAIVPQPRGHLRTIVALP
jgi:predicted ester cyclase